MKTEALDSYITGGSGTYLLVFVSNKYMNDILCNFFLYYSFFSVNIYRFYKILAPFASIITLLRRRGLLNAVNFNLLHSSILMFLA